MARILTVDDSRTMRRMISYALRSGGFDVIECEDGEDALDIARKESVDLVLTDINMPRMDGITLIKNLRSLANYRFTPILSLTTESSAEMKAAGKAAGATGWIVKPFDPDQLVSLVKRLIA